MTLKPRTIKLLVQSVFIESIRRREISVALLFTGLFIIGTIVARIVGAESDAAAVFIVNLGLSLAMILSTVVSILMAARQFPDELEQRSLYPLLAKPVSRNEYIIGKWLATWLTGTSIALVLNVLILATSRWPENFSLLHLTQTVFLQVSGIGLASAIAILLSIKLPKILAMVITFLLVFGGGPFISIIRNAVPGQIIRWTTSYIPDFSQLDLINSLTAGGSPLGFVDFSARILIVAITIVFSLSLTMYFLERKPL